MIKHLFLTSFFMCFQWISAQVFDVVAIKNSGEVDKRINLVILSEGYQAGELSTFITDATSFTNYLFSQSPFLEYANYFNVYAIEVPSNDSGADHPGTATDEAGYAVPLNTVDTYFNATYDAYSTHRLLYYGIDGTTAANTSVTIHTILANNFPMYDQALILVNASYYGGTGGEFPMASNGNSASEIIVHELGHSFANLKDEYASLDTVYFEEAFNMTKESNASLIKWKNWINTNSVGVYPYDNTLNGENWYRPHQLCKMSYLGYPFCPVCTEGIIEKIHALVSPIDSYSPIPSSITNAGFPIAFHLNVIEPTPNTLESKWTLNGTDFATNVDQVSVLETDLNSGENTLTVVVQDNTSLIRIDNHETIHAYTVSWSIDNSALGVQDINSLVNDVKITVYPNPAHDIVNIKFDSSMRTNLTIDIVSMDGKKIATKRISSSYISKIDMQRFSNGIYIAKFYANNVLIATKKLVKN